MNKFCLWCHKEIQFDVSWGNLWALTKKRRLCSECEAQLVLIEGMRCSLCSRVSEVDICTDCIIWKKLESPMGTSLSFNYSLFTYNEFMKQLVAKWKYRGDYILGSCFQATIISSFKDVFSFLLPEAMIVPIPLSENRLRERGFNQAEQLASFLPYQTKHLLSRHDDEKQSKKTRYERISATNPFIVKQTINNSVILVDDIYTTGTTLRQAAYLMKKLGAKEVFSFTLIRG